MGGDGLEAVGAEVAGEADAAALGWLPVEPAGEPGEERVEDRAVVGDDPPVPAEDAITGPQRDQGEDLARRRAADRGVVLGLLQPAQPPPVATRDPADPQPRPPVSLRHDITRH